jgi:hypothetical protein
MKHFPGIFLFLLLFCCMSSHAEDGSQEWIVGNYTSQEVAISMRYG